MLLYVGRVAPEKELDVLFDAAVRLNQKRINFKLFIVGDGPYKKQLEERNLPNVTFLGYKFGAELQMLYASADIFVFPSTSETYGNVVLEAMASGLPVVAADAGGVKENLIQMYNGIAFTPGSPDEMAEAISRLIKDDDLRTGLANNARKYSLTKSWDEVFSNLFKNYQELMESSKITKSKYSA
nr:glycosyltransferase [Desulfitibacter alkalitolerans]